MRVTLLRFAVIQTDVSYEIVTEGDDAVTAEADAGTAAEADVPQDNGEVSTTGLWQLCFICRFVLQLASQLLSQLHG